MIIATIYDKVAEKVKGLVLGKTEKEIVRKAAIGYGNEVPLRDLEIKRVGELYEMTGIIELDEVQEIIPWSIYSLPENIEEATEVLK